MKSNRYDRKRKHKNILKKKATDKRFASWKDYLANRDDLYRVGDNRKYWHHYAFSWNIRGAGSVPQAWKYLCKRYQRNWWKREIHKAMQLKDEYRDEYLPNMSKNYQFGDIWL